MEASTSGSSSWGNHDRDMERLAEVFGSSFSLDAIASAYEQAGLNVEQAGVTLSESQACSSAMFVDANNTLGEASMSLLEPSLESIQNFTCTEEESATDLPLKAVTSGISQGEYVRPSLLGMSADRNMRSGLPNNSTSGNAVEDGMLADMGEFLFTMLGDGFQLDMKKIHEVLGVCGYDLEKSMETLVGISASSLEKSDDVTTSPDTELYQDIGPYTCYQKSQLADNPGPRLMKKNGKEPRKKCKDTSNLQREILGALFTAPERVEVPPKKLIPRARFSRSNAYGIPAAKPLIETKSDLPFVAVKSLADAKEDEEDENGFMVLRQAVREYWDTMKEYYKAAADAYIKGDKEKAYKLMKEGQFFNKKAREADEKSAETLLESRDEEMLLDFSTFEPRDAIKLLKTHLSNLAGIPSIRYMKVNVGNEDGQSQTGARKRLIVKLLGKESIDWTESEDGKIISIKLEEIDRESLSFVKKK